MNPLQRLTDCRLCRRFDLQPRVSMQTLVATEYWPGVRRQQIASTFCQRPYHPRAVVWRSTRGSWAPHSCGTSTAWQIFSQVCRGFFSMFVFWLSSSITTPFLSEWIAVKQLKMLDARTAQKQTLDSWSIFITVWDESSKQKVRVRLWINKSRFQFKLYPEVRKGPSAGASSRKTSRIRLWGVVCNAFSEVMFSRHPGHFWGQRFGRVVSPAVGLLSCSFQSQSVCLILRVTTTWPSCLFENPTQTCLLHICNLSSRHRPMR